MHEVTISIGSNAPDKLERTARAIEWLGTILLHSVASPPYLTAPEPPADPSWPPYANAVVRGFTPLTPEALTLRLKEYETSCGRIRSDRRNVPIDLDLVLCDTLTLSPRHLAAPYFQYGLKLLAQ